MWKLNFDICCWFWLPAVECITHINKHEERLWEIANLSVSKSLEVLSMFQVIVKTIFRRRVYDVKMKHSLPTFFAYTIMLIVYLCFMSMRSYWRTEHCLNWHSKSLKTTIDSSVLSFTQIEASSSPMINSNLSLERDHCLGTFRCFFSHPNSPLFSDFCWFLVFFS